MIVGIGMFWHIGTKMRMFSIYCFSVFAMQAMTISQLSRLEQDLALLAKSILKQPLIQQIRETVVEKLTPDQAKALYEAAEATREPVDFFELVMGITEAEFLKLSPNEKLPFFVPFFDVNSLINRNTKESFFIGEFLDVTIDRLREGTQKKLKEMGSEGGCKFNVIEGFDDPSTSWFRNKVDIAALQADSNNQDAVFQVASLFNGFQEDPNKGLMIYLNPDHFGQEEAAAISAAPGLIYRMYYYMVLIFPPGERTHKIYYGQLERPVNLLDEFYDKPVRITVENGYPIDDRTMLERFNKMNDKVLNTYNGLVKIGIMADVQVTQGLSKLNSEPIVDGRITKWASNNNSTQRINQVLSPVYRVPRAATIPIDLYRNVARMVLQASYEGVLKSSFLADKKKVFLTLIGSGAFNNKLEWIAEALIKAVREFTTKGDMEITLVIYSSEPYRTNPYWDTFVRELLMLTHETKGEYIRYKKDGEYKIELA